MDSNSFEKKHRISQYEKALSYDKMNEYLNIITEEYKEIGRSNIGYSIMGRRIHMLSLGKGKKARLYVATHHAMEWITSVILLRFIRDICDAVRADEKVGEVKISEILEKGRFIFIPMLNPDGVELQINGASEKDLLYQRQIKMNNGSSDFSHWQANARGVDLNHNYNAGFYAYKHIEAELGIRGGAPTRYSGEYPESEPECSSLCNLVRSMNIERIYTLHTQGEEIYYTSGAVEASESLDIGKKLSELSGYKLSVPMGAAAYGGLTDWAFSKMNVPSFTIECGLGENPLPSECAGEIYDRIRDMLFYSLVI